MSMEREGWSSDALLSLVMLPTCRRVNLFSPATTVALPAAQALPPTVICPPSLFNLILAFAVAGCLVSFTPRATPSPRRTASEELEAADPEDLAHPHNLAARGNRFRSKPFQMEDCAAPVSLCIQHPHACPRTATTLRASKRWRAGARKAPLTASVAASSSATHVLRTTYPPFKLTALQLCEPPTPPRAQLSALPSFCSGAYGTRRMRGAIVRGRTATACARSISKQIYTRTHTRRPAGDRPERGGGRARVGRCVVPIQRRTCWRAHSVFVEFRFFDIGRYHLRRTPLLASVRVLARSSAVLGSTPWRDLLARSLGLAQISPLLTEASARIIIGSTYAFSRMYGQAVERSFGCLHRRVRLPRPAFALVHSTLALFFLDLPTTSYYFPTTSYFFSSLARPLTNRHFPPPETRWMSPRTVAHLFSITDKIEDRFVKIYEGLAEPEYKGAPSRRPSVQ
ncbi:hypothetical protein C8J57DRAFT_1473488 [Mycena rebaudengoi]|nr:hypothetical protein C8J57DRAFT_1473488 [Mycena rebaudengoi]